MRFQIKFYQSPLIRSPFVKSGILLVALSVLGKTCPSFAQGGDPAQQAPVSRFEAQCPEEVRTKQAQASPIKGWGSFVEVLNSRQIFTAAYLYEGHPRDGVQMTANAELTQGQDAKGTAYTLPKGKDVFLVCYYGNTLVRLIHKIPKGVNSCLIKYSETLGHVQKAICE